MKQICSICTLTTRFYLIEDENEEKQKSIGA